MYDANLADVYQPIYERIRNAVAEAVADPEELDSGDLTADGSPIWNYADRTVLLEPLSGDRVRIRNGLNPRKSEHVDMPIEPIGPVVRRIVESLGATPNYD
ncbi:MAG TPA: hypothetical protein VK669_14705 [Candidatus Limnocylindrales bacterium]|nr:hypothetical protein [Candidatus Limnocylindrales bacterium]